MLITALGILVKTPSIKINSIFTSSREETQTILLLLILAAITKRRQLPFTAWLPAAIAAPTPVSALVHSSTLVTAGIYLLCRFKETFKNNVLLSICFLIGSLTILAGGIRALYTNDFKKTVAFSTIRQIGLIITSIPLNRKLTTFFHIRTHAFFKAIIFIAIGLNIHLNNREQKIHFVNHSNMHQNYNMVFFRLRHLCLMGFPFVAGFYSKDLILESILSKWLVTPTQTIFFLGITLTLVYRWNLTLTL